MASASISRPKIRCTASAFIWTTSSALSFPEFADVIHVAIPTAPSLHASAVRRRRSSLSSSRMLRMSARDCDRCIYYILNYIDIHCWRMCHSKLCNLNNLQALPPLLLLLLVFSPKTVGLRSASDKNLKFDTYQDFHGFTGVLLALGTVAAGYGVLLLSTCLRQTMAMLEKLVTRGMRCPTCWRRILQEHWTRSCEWASACNLLREIWTSAHTGGKQNTHENRTQESAHSDRCSVFNSLEVIEFCDSDSS